MALRPLKASGSNTRVVLGGLLAWQWMRATADMPFDLAVTGGAGFSSGNGFNVVRIPFGLAAGHTFVLDNGNELTAFVHPASIDNLQQVWCERQQQWQARRRCRYRREL